ncbi:sensor histidine kinase [Flexivirga oryzae]|uniref:histidine kinase n=1 Tax=Flexivirga oryzae TaxID=1794944 RepID=A0A839N8A4_9MICO|nr:sensor histidine kinase [Flexivirga oryzae]MBB2892383.1 signal transduction histidine kinase [Flexivirga oryzae]
MDRRHVRVHSEEVRWSAALRRPLVWLAVAGAAGLIVAAVWGVRTPGPFGVKQPQVWTLAGLLPGYLTGVALTWLRAGERIPRLLLAMSCCMAVATALGTASSTFLAGHEPWAWLAVVAEYVCDIAGPAAMGAMFLLFPDGAVRRGHERVVLRVFGWSVGVLPVLLVLSNATLPAPVYAASRADTVPGLWSWTPLAFAAPAVIVSYHVATQFGLVGAALLVVRYRRLPHRQQLQTYWLLLAALAVGADVVLVQLLTAYGLLPHTIQVTTFYAVWVPALAFVPVAIWIALLRHRLLDIRLAVRRSVVYGAVSALIGVGCLLVATALGVTAGRRLPLLATVVVTIVVVLALAPVRRRLDRWASARVYGQRPSGPQLLGAFGEALEHAADLHELGPRAAAMIVDGLSVTWARLLLVLPGSAVAEEIGAAGAVADGDDVVDLSIDLVDRDDVVGRIECGPPVHGGSLSEDDRHLLVTVARQTALAVRAAHFAAELAAQLAETRRQAEELVESRRRLVHAQDTERRRLERDLHDGIQQEVVAVTAQLRLGLNQLTRDAAAARRTFEEARLAATEILTGLRELVQGIRPPVLADRGLLAAVEARVAKLPIGVVVEAGERMRTTRLEDQIESTAYFVVAEALTNVLKHAGAHEVRVELHTDGERLRLRVSDDGAGFLAADTVGTGLAGLADRVGAVGGVLHVQSAPGRGTQLEALLPIGAAADA